MARKKVVVLKASSIARYQRAARSGDTKAIARLAELGIEVAKAKAVGRPQKAFSQLSKKTQQQYARQIAKNIEQLKKIDKSYEVNQKYRAITSSAEVYGILSSQVYGSETADVYFENLRKYAKTNAVTNRFSEIAAEYQSKEGLSLKGLTTDEIRQFYESKYFVLTESNEYDSEGLRMYYEENGETVSQTRLKDFINDVLLTQYQFGSEDWQRVMAVYNNVNKVSL